MLKNCFFYLCLLPLLLLAISSCEKDEPFVLIPLDQDIQIGAQVHQQILGMPDSLPILSQQDYPQAYQYLMNIMDRITASDNILYKEQFGYDKVYIIRNDQELNAFATPGGYVYVYTGLLKYLNSEDHLAGVLAHEVAHADRRHTVRALQRQVGLQLLLDFALGQNQNAIVKVLSALGDLRYSRENESESDEYSVIYLSNPESPYECDGAAGFFEKLQSQGGSSGTPEFLSTHPSPENRIQDIQAVAAELGCDTSPCETCNYAQFLSLLP